MKGLYYNDLTPRERLTFALKVVRDKVQGWEELKQASRDFGFEPDEDMPSVLDFHNMKADAVRKAGDLCKYTT